MSAFERALADHRAGRLDEAAAQYRAILEDNPDHADSCHLLGLTLHQRGENQLAVAMIGRALQLQPDIANYHNSLGLALHGQGRFNKALGTWQKAVSLDPEDADIHNNLGMVLCDMRHYGDAERALRRALVLRPDYAGAMNNLGRVLVWKGEYDDAAALLTRACARDPGSSTFWNSLGVALREAGENDRALDAFSRALEIAPDLADAHVNRAQIMLLRGEYNAGWREHEWRLRYPRHAARDATRYWSGGDVRGRTVLLWAEQGYGDAIQFIRYASVVGARGARVIVQCRPALHGLFSAIEGIAEIVGPDDAPHHDCHAALMSLPGLLGGALDPKPYLGTPAAMPLGAKKARRIGLVWAGNPDHANDRNRSHALRDFAPLASANAEFYALQTGDAAMDPAPDGLAVTTLGDRLKNFADTASALAAMDLVIAVDTATAHLAGALGRPVWLILPPNPDWRWGEAGETTSWYGSMRLFRRARGEDPAALFERISGELCLL
jgi:Tfp pilus assembly protein PilF